MVDCLSHNPFGKIQAPPDFEVSYLKHVFFSLLTEIIPHPDQIMRAVMSIVQEGTARVIVEAGAGAAVQTEYTVGIALAAGVAVEQ